MMDIQEIVRGKREQRENLIGFSFWIQSLNTVRVIPFSDQLARPRVLQQKSL